MVVYTMTKKQIMRVTLTVLVCLAAALIIIFAVFGSVTASAEAGKMPVCRAERGDNKVALTFTCAWDASDTDKLLDTLSAANVRATFFVTGEFCDAHPDAVRSMSKAGHSVQNCSDKNIHIKGMNINDLIADTKSAAQKIKALTGKDPTLYRAPFGDYDDKTLTTIEGMGYIPVQWDVDSKDLDDPDADSVRKRVTDSAASGSIILFHNDCGVTAEALPQTITELKQKGFEFAKAEEVVFTNNYIIDENGVQQYRPAVSVSLPIVYCDYNSSLDSAFEKMRENLTIQQIYDLSSVGRVGLVDEIKSFLNEAELYAVREATYEELMECYMTLVYAAENYGCGGTYTEQYEDIPQIVPSEEDNDTDTDEYVEIQYEDDVPPIK
ncbi:MAG: polysaccharide deacetylase family protein [Ruminiclostridium sp.]|nr:polysaccharide deacetylase family protein [Ruminiclostridium sp.]